MKYLVFLLLALPAQAQSKVVLSWVSGNTGSSALPTCPATSPASCVSGFTITMDGTQIAGPSALGPTATTFTQTPLPAVGSHTYSLVENGFDASGKAITSTAVTASLSIAAPVTLNAPTGFSAKAQ